MTTSDLYRTYRKVFASSADEKVACWYLGTLNARPYGCPEIPLLRVATVMIYRTETLSANTCRIHWDEVGEFIDHTTGRPAKSWLNPVTGVQMNCASGFAEGDAHYTVKAIGKRLSLALHQPGARVKSVAMQCKTMDEQVWVRQVEKKTRGLHGPGLQRAFTATTELSLFAAKADVDDPSQSWAPATGSYSFVLDGLMPWMGFGDRKGRTVVRGVMHKARPDEAVDPAAHARLKKMYPDFFKSLT